jgi:hypothetical protein
MNLRLPSAISTLPAGFAIQKVNLLTGVTTFALILKPCIQVAGMLN